MTYKPKKFKPKTCKVCGKLFTPKGPTSVFCSAECRAEAEKARDRERYARNHPNSKPGKARIHAEEDRTRREAADKRLTIKAGSSPCDYAKAQLADSIEKFARIDLGDGEETHMKDEPIYDPVDVELDHLRGENRMLKAENERLTEMIAELNRSKTSKTLEILKAVMDVMGVEA